MKFSDDTVWKHVLCVLVTDVLRKRNIGFIESHQHDRLRFCFDWVGSEDTFHSCDGCIMVRLEGRAFVNGRINVSLWSDDFGSFVVPNVQVAGVKFRVELVLSKGMYMSSHNLIIDISEPVCFDEIDGLVGRHFNG